MPIKVIKRYGNIRKCERANGQVVFGFEIQVNGRKHRPTKWLTKPDAEKALNAFKLKLANRSVGIVTATPVKLAELIKDYLAEMEDMGRDEKVIKRARGA